MPGLPALIRLEDLDVLATPPQFESLTASQLGSMDADLAYLDDQFSAAVKAFAEGAASVDALDALFADSATLASVITEDTLAADTLALANDLATGTSVLNDLGGLCTTPGAASSTAAASVGAAVTPAGAATVAPK